MTLIMRPTGAGQLCDWVIAGDSGSLPASEAQGTREEAISAANGQRLVMLVPGTNVLLTEVGLPATNRRQRLKVVPYALEDQLAADVESLHFAVGERVDGLSAVAVVDRDIMQEWVSVKSGMQSPASVVPDFLAVPLVSGGWSVLALDNVVLVRTGAQSGFAVESENLTTCLQALERQEDVAQPKIIRVYGDLPEPAALAFATFEADGVVIERQPAAHPMSVLAQGVAEGKGLDLLQGAFAPHDGGQGWKHWVPAAVLLGAWLLMHIGLTTFNSIKLSAEDRELSAAIEQVYRDTFPQARNIVNPRLQMEQQLKSIGEQSIRPAGEFLSRLSVVAATLQAMPETELRRVDFREGRFDMQLTAPSLQSIDQIKQRLEEATGVSVKIVSAAKADDGVDGRIRIVGGLP